MIIWLIRWWKPLVLAGILIAAATIVWQYGDRQYEAGRQAVQRELAEGNQRAREESRNAAAEIERLDDDGVRDRARERMRSNQAGG